MSARCVGGVRAPDIDVIDYGDGGSLEDPVLTYIYWRAQERALYWCQWAQMDPQAYLTVTRRELRGAAGIIIPAPSREVETLRSRPGVRWLGRMKTLLKL